MSLKGYCGELCGTHKKCNSCKLNLSIPCGPSCSNLTIDGKINIAGCLRDKCEEVKYIFDMINCTNDELLKCYGKIAPYPYEIN